MGHMTLYVDCSYFLCSALLFSRNHFSEDNSYIHMVYTDVYDQHLSTFFDGESITYQACTLVVQPVTYMLPLQ